MADNTAILKTPIEDLGFTSGFCEKCRLMGFEKLEDVVATPPGALVRKRGFSYSWLGELVQFMQSKGLLHKLQVTPGNTTG